MQWMAVLLTLSTWGASVENDIYSIPVQTIDGATSTLASYKGKTLLVVNTASKCGYTKQYDALEKVYERYKDRGVVVLGFPSNDFGAQEPGTNAEIKTFCQSKFNVKFPLFAKAPVTGDAKQPLYKYLITKAPAGGEIEWNFEKFVVSPTGKVTARFASKVTPDDKKVAAALEDAIKESVKK